MERLKPRNSIQLFLRSCYVGFLLGTAGISRPLSGPQRNTGVLLVLKPFSSPKNNHTLTVILTKITVKTTNHAHIRDQRVKIFMNPCFVFDFTSLEF